ncbi:MAG: hypothetical protein E6Q67_12570 [Roseateles sp.]|nr:MAG: hypothetical protein E6Q67_12570 [Roseateles sp.]
MTDAQVFAQLQKLTPAEAVAYLQGRGQLSTTFGWQDLWQDEHAHQFTISRLTRADLLQTLQEKITASVQGDLSRRDFMRDGQAALQEAGWWGSKEVIEPETGEILKTKFDPSRLKLVYDTNTRQAYAAGQWERVQRTKRTHPFLRYITKRDERVREAHRAWDNVTLPVDDGFWSTHYPPNGWRCRCRVVAVSQAEYDKGSTPTGAAMRKDAPEVVMRPWENRRTGETLQVPAGVDPGFGYNAGQARQRALGQMVQEKLTSLPVAIANAARRDGLELRQDIVGIAEAVTHVQRVMASPKDKQPALMLGSVSALAVKKAAGLGVNIERKLVALDHDGVRHALLSHGRAATEEPRGQIPVTADDIAQFRELFNRAVLVAGDPPTSKDGTPRLEGSAWLGGIEYHFAAVVRRRSVVLLTMWKRPGK